MHQHDDPKRINNPTPDPTLQAESDQPFVARPFATGSRPPLDPHEVLRMQQAVGNRSVMRWIQRENPTPAPPSTGPETRTLPPNPYQEVPPLTPRQMRVALRYNDRRYNADSTRLIQRALHVEPSGQWDEATVQAVQHFQADHQMTPDGKLGPNGFAQLTQTIGSEGLDTSDPRQALLLFAVTIAKDLTFERQVANPNLGRIQAHVLVEARFDPRFNVHDFEYRQYIRGTVNLFDQTNPLNAIPVNNQFRHLPRGGLTTDWQEDGDTSVSVGTAGHHYGYRDARDNPRDNRDRYLPDRATGDRYEAYDYPELAPIPCSAGDQGDQYEWAMYFRGEILFRGEVIDTRLWSLVGTIVIPDPSVSVARAVS